MFEVRQQSVDLLRSPLLHSTPHSQLNVFVSARRHKLQLFAGFQRALVAVVVPPTEEWRRRLALRQAQDGERIPDTALLKLKGSNRLQVPSLVVWSRELLHINKCTYNWLIARFIDLIFSKRPFGSLQRPCRPDLY